MSARAPSPTCYRDQSLTVTHLVYLVPGIHLAIITLLKGGFYTHHVFEGLSAIFQKVTLLNNFVDSCYIFYSLINEDHPSV